MKSLASRSRSRSRSFCSNPSYFLLYFPKILINLFQIVRIMENSKRKQSEQPVPPCLAKKIQQLLSLPTGNCRGTRPEMLTNYKKTGRIVGQVVAQPPVKLRQSKYANQLENKPKILACKMEELFQFKF